MFYENVKKLCKERNTTITKMSEAIGLSNAAATSWKKGSVPKASTLEKISAYFGVSVDYLLGKSERNPLVVDNDGSLLSEAVWTAMHSKDSNIIPMPAMKRIPLLGTIACGEPILAQENLEGEVFIPSHVTADFALRCKGDSMINARIFDGDIVYIRQQDTVEDGQIAAVLIDEEATLKRVHFFPDRIVLEAANPLYPPIVRWGEDMLQVRIIGKAVAFTSTIL